MEQSPLYSLEDCDSSRDLVAAQVGITSSFANFPPLGIRVCTDRMTSGWFTGSPSSARWFIMITMPWNVFYPVF